MMNWQSMRSVIPPCPGIESPKSLSLKVRFRPEAKKPPKGAMTEANVAQKKEWICIGAMVMLKLVPGGRKKRSGVVYVFGMNTGLISHSRPLNIVAPRSFAGQMKYLYRKRRLVSRTAK